jgi:hypothetical protein
MSDLANSTDHIFQLRPGTSAAAMKSAECLLKANSLRHLRLFMRGVPRAHEFHSIKFPPVPIKNVRGEDVPSLYSGGCS